MLSILLHSSKTMRSPEAVNAPYQAPALLAKAQELATYLRGLAAADIKTVMQLSDNKAAETKQLLATWTSQPDMQRPAIDAFLGDIYSGLQVQSFTDADRQYANEHLYILSGLYGVLRALDSIYPYRLEMGYRLPDEPYRNLYSYWGNQLAAHIHVNATIINLSAVEYTKALLPHLDSAVIITPKFLTISSKTGEPTFVTVHAKVARGAFARWLIQRRIEDTEDIIGFNDIGYEYSSTLSTPDQPVFVCPEFKGLGLSVRLS